MNERDKRLYELQYDLRKARKLYEKARGNRQLALAWLIYVLIRNEQRLRYQEDKL